MVFNCEELAGKNPQLENGPHDGQLLHQGKPPLQMARLPGDAEAAECHRNEPWPVVGRSPDLPARDTVTVSYSYEFIFWKAPDKGCTKLVDVMGFVLQENVGQGTMDVMSELFPAPSGWCRRHQPW